MNEKNGRIVRMEDLQKKGLTRQEANEMVENTTMTDMGKVIGVTNRPIDVDNVDGVFLICSNPGQISKCYRVDK